MGSDRFTVEVYVAANGKTPFKQWRQKLKDVSVRQKVDARIARVRIGNFGDHRSAGAGVSELRIDSGPGYRIYYGIQGSTVVVLLCGGDKSTQAADIKMAQRYWREYTG
jgi:putative addiction module killer protein